MPQLILLLSCLINSSIEETKVSDTGQAFGQSEFSLDGMQGALVTNDCTYETYPYAIDILLSCGSERFNDELRLHTFKRHSIEHQKVFNDQLITYRNQQLWFDNYSTPRCIHIRNQGRFYLTTDENECDSFEFIETTNGYKIKESESGFCATIDGIECADNEWTGGIECGGIDHRYLPLVLGVCNNGLEFSFIEKADSCTNEYPDDDCFE